MTVEDAGGGPQIPLRPPVPSPRTEATPMAFTWGEFGRGLWWTLVCFNLGYPLSIVVVELFDVLVLRSNAGGGMGDFSSMLSMVPVMMMICVPVSLVTGATYGGAAAYGLGFLLRRQRSLWLHRGAFAALGAVVGTLAVLIFNNINGMGPGLNFADWWAVVVTAVSAPAGWEVASRKALRIDARERAAAAAE